MKDFWQEIHRMKHKKPDDVLLADVFAEMKKKSEKEARLAKIKSTKEYYLKGEKKESAKRELKEFSDFIS